MNNPVAIRIHLPTVVLLSNADNQVRGFSENPRRQRRPTTLKAYANTAITAMVRNKIYTLSSMNAVRSPIPYRGLLRSQNKINAPSGECRGDSFLRREWGEAAAENGSTCHWRGAIAY